MMTSSVRRLTVASIGAPVVMAAALLIGGINGATGTANADTGAVCVQLNDAQCTWVDSSTGRRVQEDDPLWYCVDMGDHVCGPGNANGVPAGCYDEGGVMVAPWPCYVVVDSAGNGDVYR